MDNGRSGQQLVAGGKGKEICNRSEKQLKESTAVVYLRRARIPPMSRQETKNVCLAFDGIRIL